MHTRSKVWHLLDYYFIICKSDIDDICNVKPFHGLEGWIDHRLVQTKFRIMIRRKDRREPVGIPWCLNVHNIFGAVLRKEIQIIYPALKIPRYGKISKTRIFNVLGYATARRRDWFEESEAEIQ